MDTLEEKTTSVTRTFFDQLLEDEKNGKLSTNIRLKISELFIEYKRERENQVDPKENDTRTRENRDDTRRDDDQLNEKNDLRYYFLGKYIYELLPHN